MPVRRGLLDHRLMLARTTPIGVPLYELFMTFAPYEFFTDC